MHVPFPHQAVRVDVEPYIAGRGALGASSISGVQRAVPQVGARWVFQCTFMITPENRGVWNAFIAQMQGVLSTTDVPAFRSPRMKTNRGGTIGWNNPVGGPADRETFTYFGFGRDSVAWVVAAQAAPLRATTLVVAVDPVVEGLRPGDLFSINGRLYEVVTHHVAADDSGHHMLNIFPPLRAAVAAGTVVEAAFPTCVARFATEDAGRPQRRSDKLWECSATLIEAP